MTDDPLTPATRRKLAWEYLAAEYLATTCPDQRRELRRAMDNIERMHIRESHREEFAQKFNRASLPGAPNAI